MKAAILTAGAATPLGRLTADVPKALVEVAGVAIAQRAIGALLDAGVDELVIATGHGGPRVREAVARWVGGVDVAVTFVACPDYAVTGNAVTLRALRPHLDGAPFFLLDDDVVFDPAVLERLLERGLDAVAVRSVGPVDADDVQVRIDDQDRIVAIGRGLPRGPGWLGEAIGVALLSGDTATRLFAALEVAPRDAIYEDALQAMIDGGGTLFGVDIGTRYAIGIDTVADLRRANATVPGRPELAPVGADDARLSV